VPTEEPPVVEEVAEEPTPVETLIENEVLVDVEPVEELPEPKEEPTAPLPTEQLPTAKPGMYSVGELARYLPYADVDQDGIVNKDDKCPEEAGPPETFGCPPGDPRGLPVEPDPTWDRLYFETDKTYLPGKSRVILNNAVRYLRSHPNAKLLILGHADSYGSNPYNDNLSRRRCDAAKAYLLKQGVDESRLIIEYYGETQPAASNASEEGRQQNRRVELRMIE
jgi:outer membrane protein OmpA-like peptidoglycan-associated protein